MRLTPDTLSDTFTYHETGSMHIDQANAGLRATLRDRSPVVASFVLVPRVEIIEMMAIAGCDAVIIDMEHGPVDVASLPNLAAFASSAGVHSIARIPEARASTIGAVLDAGFGGVMVPHVSSAEAAAATVAAARFPPAGIRSLNPYVRGGDYDATDPDGLSELDAGAAVIGMLEGRSAIAELDAILATPGLDAVFVGPVDLSGEMGHPGDPNHPDVLSKIEEIFVASIDAGVACGVYAPTPERANRWFDLGATIVAVSADSAMILDAFRATFARLDVKGPRTTS